MVVSALEQSPKTSSSHNILILDSGYYKNTYDLDATQESLLSELKFEFIKCIEMTLHCSSRAGHCRILHHNSMRMLSPAERMLYWLLHIKHDTLLTESFLSELK
jgi:hypothetical protein